VGGLFDGIANVKGKTVCKPIKCEINDGRGVERKNLTQDEAAHDGDTERAAKFRTDAGAERERKTAK
jgi:hypothetical protein